MKTVKKLFFVWQEDEEKAFLEKMAREGFVLSKVSFGKYVFSEEEPKDLVYAFDFRLGNELSDEEYLYICEELEWKRVAIFGGWNYFYKLRSKDERKNLFYSDVESKKSRLRRLIFFLCLTGFPLYYQTFIILPAASIEKSSFIFGMRIFMAVFTVIHLIALFRILLIYKRIKKT